MAQVSFYRGHSGYYSSIENKDGGIYFATDTGQIFVNGKEYGGLTEDQKAALSSPLVKSISVDNNILQVTYTNSDSPVSLGYVLEADQVANLDVLSSLIDNSESGNIKLKVATKDQDGLMTRDQVLLLESLDEFQGGELSTITNDIADLKDEVSSLKGSLTGAFHFIGKLGELPGETESSTYAQGDVILVGTAYCRRW